MLNAIGSVTSQRCPRCSAPVVGGYKFCPSCAYRLNAGPAEPVPAPAPRGSRWKTLFLWAAGLSAVLAAALGFVLLSYPHWFVAPTPPKPTTEVDISRRLTVAEIPSLLVDLRPAYGVYYPWQTDDSELPEPVPVHVWYTLRVMKYEVTRGMYAEFLDDLRAHPDRIPARWLVNDRVADRAEVDLLDHVPADWVVRDEDGEPASWAVAVEDVNLPVTQVAVDDALGFAEWASERTGVRLALPVEVEWLRAANGGNPDQDWPWGDERLFYAANTSAYWRGQKGAPLPVQWPYSEPLGSGGATPEGLHAMAGNVQEMVLPHDVEEDRFIIEGTRWLKWKQLETFDEVYGYGGSYKMGIEDSRIRLDARVRYGTWEARDDLGFRLVSRDS